MVERLKLFENYFHKDPSGAMKSIFYFLDNGNEKLFRELFDWVRLNSPEHYYRNISHIVGVYNSRSLEWLDSNDEHFDKILDKFIVSESRDYLRRENVKNNRRKLFEQLNVPSYGSWKTLGDIFESTSDTKTKMIITTLFRNKVIITREIKEQAERLNIEVPPINSLENTPKKYTHKDRYLVIN